MNFIKVTSVETGKVVYLNILNVRMIQEGKDENGDVCTEFVFQDGGTFLVRESVDKLMKGDKA